MLALPTTNYLRVGSHDGVDPPPSTTALPHRDSETDSNTESDDDGSCFDLHFTLPPQNDDVDHHDNNNEDSESECECEGEFEFALSPSNPTDPNPSLSPSQLLLHDDLDLNPSELNSKPRFHASSLLKSATKFRVFMSGLKKSKSNIVTSSHNNKDKDSHDSVASPNLKKQSKQQRKLFTMKFRVEEVPIMSLFTRDNSSKGGGGGASVNDAAQNKKHNPEQESQTQSPSSASDEKRLRKYLKMVKPMYFKVSRRYAEKLRFSGQLNMSSSAAPPSDTAGQKPSPSEAVAGKVKVQKEGGPSVGTANIKGQKQRNLALPAGLRVVCKHLGKSRSAAGETAAAPAPAAAELVSSRRRDDSLLQQHDGIQNAILHCKSSFNSSTESESSQLPQCVSDPLHENEISPESSSKSINEGKSKQRVLFSNVSLMHSVRTEKENATT